MIRACAVQLGREDILADVHCAADGVAGVCLVIYVSGPPGILGVRCPSCQEDIGSGHCGYEAVHCAHYMHQGCVYVLARDQGGFIPCLICGVDNKGFACVYESMDE